jgi:hypothetical protein
MLRGEVHSQNNSYWNVENPGLIHEHPFCEEKIVFGAR